MKNETDWIPLSATTAPPKNIPILCRTLQHGDVKGIRRDDIIHVEISDGDNPEVIRWKFLEESQT